mgnify:CR=1 FL=1
MNPLMLLRNATVRGLLYQLLTLGAVVGLFAYLGHNAAVNLAAQNTASGFEYLGREAGFRIGEALIPYQPSDSYGRALLVGFLNTVRVALIACILATFIGTTVGIARLSHNPLLARLTAVYVEAFRNTPLLLQLFFFYALMLLLPTIRQAIHPLPGILLSNRGLFFPLPDWQAGHWPLAVALIVGAGLAIATSAWARRRQRLTGQQFPTGWAGTGLILGGALLGLGFSDPVHFSIPELKGFNVQGGGAISPEFTALLLGLTLNSAASIAEIVRSGIQAVDKGQREAAASLGLRPGRIMRLVVLPQALRMIIPALSSGYLNITKNSSLAVAIGYPDLVSISNTTISQTGQAIEAILVFMSVYLGLSLTTSAFMNWYNDRVALKER